MIHTNAVSTDHDYFANVNHSFKASDQQRCGMPQFNPNDIMT